MFKPSKRSFFLFGLSGLAIALGACATPTETKVSPKVKSAFHVDRNEIYTPKDKKGKKLVRIALLAPFNSPSNAIKAEADALRAATELAIKDKGDGSQIIMPIDSGDSATTSAIAAKRAIQTGADFIIGPLFSSGVSAVAPYAQANDTLLFSLSTDTKEAGNGVFLLSFLPEDEARRIVSYAGKRGIKKLILLVPQSQYGERIEQAATKAAQRAGITIIGTARYDSTRNASVNGAAAAQTAAKFVVGTNYNDTAILIPERGNMLKYLASVLSKNGASVSKVRYLGTGLWNDDSVLQDSRLLGSWFVAPDNSKRAEFERHIKNATNQPATRLAGMGYDGAALIASLSKNGDSSKITARSLENSNGFDGVDGRFRFDNGVIERAMSVLEVSPTGVKTIERPQERF